MTKALHPELREALAERLCLLYSDIIPNAYSSWKKLPVYYKDVYRAQADKFADLFEAAENWGAAGAATKMREGLRTGYIITHEGEFFRRETQVLDLIDEADPRMPTRSKRKE